MSSVKVRSIIVLLGLGLVFLAGCSSSSSGNVVSAADAPLAVTAATVASQNIERRVEITGTLAAWDEAVVSSEVDGRALTIKADLGDHVKKGASLAVLADEEYALKVAQTKADLVSAEANYRRIADLAAHEMASQQQVDDQKRMLDVARAAANLAQKKLNDTMLRAPFDGIVAKRMINAGEYVRVGNQAFQVVRITPLKFKGDVPERYAGDLHVGDDVQAYLESSSDAPLTGKIVRIAPAVAADTRSFSVEAEIDNPDEAVKPGTFARVSILTQKIDQALTIPESAVFSFAGNPHVFVVEQNKARDRAIETAGKYKDRVLVAKGLVAGDRVVSSGVELLTDGRAIAIREDNAQ